jgi:branched-chain amino acid transport system permease protein
MTSAITLFEQLLNGLTIGMVYVLLAAGLSIIFGVMDVINFAHGELFALGAYFAVSITAPIEGGFWLALVVAPLAAAAVGMAIERTTLRPLYGRNPLYHILLTFGLVLILKDLITTVWGHRDIPLPIPGLLDGTVTLLGFQYGLYNYFTIAFGALLALGTWLLLQNSRFGIVVRAGAEDREMVRNLGIDIDRYYTLVFGFGTALAAVGGVVLGASRNVGPGMGDSVIIPAFVIVVLGGLGSFRGAVFGGLAVGVIQTLGRTFVPQLEGLVIYLLMIAILLVRPYGLFGNPEWQSGGNHAEQLYDTLRGGVLTHEQRKWAAVGLVGALLLVPLGAGVLYSPYVVTLLTDALIWALFALSLDFVMGYAGLVSLGHAMFFGLGVYAAVLTMLHVSQSVFLAVGVAVALNAVVAWVIGYLSIRVSGVYFAMITLAFAQLFHNLVVKFDWTGSTDGLFGADPFYGVGGVGVRLYEFEFVDPTILFYYLLVAVVAASYLLARRTMRAPFGSVLQGIRESEERASFVGYDVTAYKRRAFVVSGSLAGLSGAMFALKSGYAAPSFLHWLRSGIVIVMTVLGGMGTLYGPMLGAGLYIGIQDYLSSFIDQWQLVLGVVFVLFVIFVPQGLVSLPRTVVDRFDLSVPGDDPPEAPREVEES